MRSFGASFVETCVVFIAYTIEHTYMYLYIFILFFSSFLSLSRWLVRWSTLPYVWDCLIYLFLLLLLIPSVCVYVCVCVCHYVSLCVCISVLFTVSGVVRSVGRSTVVLACSYFMCMCFSFDFVCRHKQISFQLELSPVSISMCWFGFWFWQCVVRGITSELIHTHTHTLTTFFVIQMFRSTGLRFAYVSLIVERSTQTMKPTKQGFFHLKEAEEQQQKTRQIINDSYRTMLPYCEIHPYTGTRDQLAQYTHTLCVMCVGVILTENRSFLSI